MERFSKEMVTAGIAEVEEIYERRGVTSEEKDTIWQAISAFCCYQIQEPAGDFYEAMEKELLSSEKEDESAG